MAARVASIHEIPGTIVFDGTQCRRGYHLNMCCMTLLSASNRDEFRADEAAYLAKFPLTDEQRQAVLGRDYNSMIRSGGNIYYLGKLAAVDGHTFQKMGSLMSGKSEADFRKMMLAGGRSVDAPLTHQEGK